MLHRIEHALELRRRAAGGGVLALTWRLAALALLPLELYLNLATKVPINSPCVIEGGVYLSDRGGIVLGCDRIGSGTLIQHHVTFGMNPLGNGELPVLGRDVWVGHDSVIYGPIDVGDGATILPGSVLGTSVPAGAVIEGNPGRIIMDHFDNSALRATLGDPVLPLDGAATAPSPRESQELSLGEVANVR